MTWSAPLAGLLALAIALPIVAHLLSRRRPTQVPFPTLRFLRRGSPVSRRLRRIADVPLLLLRIAIVGAIAAAAAGPTLVTPARQRAWQERLHRVIVVDERLKDTAQGTISELSRQADSSHVFETVDVAGKLSAIDADLAARATDSRVELVVLWDGSRDALTLNDIAAVPPAVGVRLQVVDGGSSVEAPRGVSNRRDASIEVVAVAADEATRDALVGRLRETGTLRPRAAVRVIWPGATESATDSVPASPQGLPGVLDAIADDRRLRDAAWRSLPDARAADASGERMPAHARVLARAGSGEPLLHGWWAGETLVLAMHAAPSSPLAWWSLVSVAEALADRERDFTGSADEIWTTEQRTAAGRDAQVPATSSMPGGIDARAAWVVVLVLLIVEQVWRRRGQVEADAA